MAGVTETNEALFYHRADRKEALQVAGAGAAVGILIPFVGWVLNQLILRPLFCQDTSASACGSAEMISYYVATVLVTAAVVPVLANWGTFRGLLIAVGSAVALWGLQGYVSALAGSNWLEYALFSSVLFAAAYALFYWLMRLRNFGLGLGLMLVVILAIRWALVS